MTEKKFTKEHEWVENRDQIVIVGITEFAQDQLGDIVSIEFPQVASSFKQNDVMAIIDSVKASSDIYCPIDGEIIEINEKLLDQPELINQSRPVHRSRLRGSTAELVRRSAVRSRSRRVHGCDEDVARRVRGGRWRDPVHRRDRRAAAGHAAEAPARGRDPQGAAGRRRRADRV